MKKIFLLILLFLTVGLSYTQVPNPPILFPVNGGNPVHYDSITIFKWSKVLAATSYRIQILSGATTVVNQVVTDTFYIAPPFTFNNNAYYYWMVASINLYGQGMYSGISQFSTTPAIPDPPTLLYPPDSSVVPVVGISFDWNDVPGAVYYKIQISNNPAFSTTVLNLSGLTNSAYYLSNAILANNTKYYWRVNASNVSGTGQWSSVWRIITGNQIGINQISSEIPSEYKLYDNYPNPFNPKTIIRFKIKDSRLVTLKIYDVIGKDIVTLVNEKLSPGEYEVSFDGSDLPSGIYFYKLETNNFSETKRMILLK